MSKMRHSSMFKSAFAVTLLVVSFKLFAFVKQAVIAAHFGTTLETDVFFLAHDFVLGLGEAIVKSVSMSMISIYTYLRVQKGREVASDLISGLLTIMLPIAALMSGVFFLSAPLIAKALAPSYNQDQSELLAVFVRLLSGMFVFVAIEVVSNAVLDSEKRFFVPRLQSFFNSLAVIGAALWLSRLYGVYALVVAQYVGSILFLLFLLHSVRRFVRLRWHFSRQDVYVKRVFHLAIPLIIGNSVIYFNQVISKAIASRFDEGTVTMLAYSHVLEQLVTSVMIVNIGNVMFAHFANYLAEKQEERVVSSLIRTMNTLVTLLIPISVVVLLRSQEIVKIVFYRGNFTMDSVLHTSVFLQLLAVSFFAVAVRDILTKSMYAYQDTKTPVRNNVISMAINIVLSLLLSRVMGANGIVVGASISVFIGAGLNIMSFKHIKPEFPFGQLYACVWKGLLAVIVSVLAVLGTRHLYEPKNMFLMIIIDSLIVIITYSVVLYKLKSKEVLWALSSFKGLWSSNKNGQK